jgi:hypothetical protein
MAITKEELSDFIRFADGKLAHGGAESLVELACEWQMRQPGDELDPDSFVLEADPDVMRKLAEAFPDKRNEHPSPGGISHRDGVTTAEMIGRAVLAAARAARK